MRHFWSRVGRHRLLGAALAVVVLCAITSIPGGTATSTPAPLTATPMATAEVSAVDPGVDVGDPPANGARPLLERIPAWQVTGGVLLAAFVATVGVFVAVRFRGQGAS